MQLQAINHIPLSKDAYMVDEQTIVIRIKAGKGDLESASLYYGDRVCMTDPIITEEVCMIRIASDSLFDYFEARIKSQYTRVCYYFLLKDVDGQKLYYCEYGFTKKMEFCRTQYFQFPYMHREDLVRMPEWTENMVMYHIFPDSFADGRRCISGKGKTVQLENGMKSESKNGGTLTGIADNLDYIETMGINCLYLNPIFTAASYHKYDTIDYLEVDPSFGTKEDLKKLVKMCHVRGIKVILDGVFNHCGSGFLPFQDVLKKGEKSKYCDWFYKLRFPVQYDAMPNYEAFAYVREMPKLNTGNPKVVEYLCNVGRYWIREADIDGWRLDVANEINHDFWRAFRKAVKEEKKDCFLIGEIWEDSSVWLMGDQFDSTMNYTFSYICREFFAKNEISVSEFDSKIHRMNLRYPEMVARAHDVSRFLSDCDGDLSKLKLAVLYMMCAIGIPSVFYGDEQGITGTDEPEYRKAMPWNKKDPLIDFYHDCVAMRKNSAALCKGTYETISSDDDNGIYVFARKTDDETVVIALNISEQKKEVLVPGNKWVDLLKNERRQGDRIVCEKKSGIVLKRM